MSDTTVPTISLEEAQSLISAKQADIMQEAEEFANKIITQQEDESRNLITTDEQEGADTLLSSI